MEKTQDQIIAELTEQLNQSKLEVEKLKQQRIDEINKQPAHIYKIYHKGRLIYIGKDMSLALGRIRQHLADRQKILTNYQFIDIYLATVPEDEITFECIPTKYNETGDIEAELIKQLNPLCNQTLNSDSVFTCKNCQISYRYRGALNNHKKKCSQNQIIQPAL